MVLFAVQGYNARSMAKMDLCSIMPPPYGQLHRLWLKVSAWVGLCMCASACLLFCMPHAVSDWLALVLVRAGPPQDMASKKATTASCRSGAVVHLLSANGSKVPVTMQMTSHDDGQEIKHIIKVREGAGCRGAGQPREGAPPAAERSVTGTASAAHIMRGLSGPQTPVMGSNRCARARRRSSWTRSAWCWM